MVPLLLPFLYAETHYRFPYFFSFLKKAEPELIADAPHRVEPGSRVPVLLLAKDASHYPCTLIAVRAAVLQNGMVRKRIDVLSEPVRLQEPFWWRVFEVDVEDSVGWIDLDVEFEIEVRGKRKVYWNDNHVTTSHRPLRVYRSREALPKLEAVHYGDCHTHSTYTNDQVEFGSPLEASIELSKSIGLSFFCVTDHSYDLDDSIDNYLTNDPSLPKWNHFQAEVERVNASNHGFAVIRGEELSCRNLLGENIHLLLLGNRSFVAGSGDGAEQWFQTRSEHAASEILNALEQGCLAIAAHPREPVPSVQRLLLRRGMWEADDLIHSGLSALQLSNGEWDAGSESALRYWVDQLLLGRRVFAFGGNDAHGNFNRFRQLSIPFVRFVENQKQLFGRVRTAVFFDGQVTEQRVLDAMRAGQAVVTDGPIVNVRLAHDTELTRIGSSLLGSSSYELEAEVRSTAEFGSVKSIRIHRGTIGSATEELLVEAQGSEGQREACIKFDVDVTVPCYIRVEVWTDELSSHDRRAHFAFSNPVWLSP